MQCCCASVRLALIFTQVGPGNNDMDTARALRSDHPEVVMFGRRRLGDAAGLYAKAKAFADAWNDEMAVKVRAQRWDAKARFFAAPCR